MEGHINFRQPQRVAVADLAGGGGQNRTAGGGGQSHPLPPPGYGPDNIPDG
jgi:hypothetical protein